jgi:predicted nucleic acid-binding Zn ribbon protein
MPKPQPEASPQSARSLSDGILISCPVCAKPLGPRQKACSGKCRAEWSRLKREQAQAERDAKVRLLLREALALLGDYSDALDRVE